MVATSFTSSCDFSKFYLKNQYKYQILLNLHEHKFNKQFNSLMCHCLFIWEQEGLKGEFQTRVLGLVQQVTEKRTRHARGPVRMKTYNLLHKCVDD